MAETLGDPHLRGETLLLTSWHYYLCMKRRDQASACRQAIGLLRPTGDITKLGEALGNIQMASIQIGRPLDIAGSELETRHLAEQLGRFDIRAHQLYSETQRDWLLNGNVAALDEGLRQVETVAGSWLWIAEATQAQCLFFRGEGSAALERARASVSHEPPAGTHFGMGWGMLFFCESVFAESSASMRETALELLEANLEHLPVAGRLNTIGSWSALLKVVEGLVIMGEGKRAAAFYPLVLEALATKTVLAFDASHLIETVAGMAAAAEGDGDAAEAHYNNALQIAHEMPFISEQAEAQYWYARMLASRDAAIDRQRAKDLLESALGIYRMRKMVFHEKRCEALLNAIP